MKGKKIVVAATSAAVIALAVGAVYFYQASMTAPAESTYKETIVERGNLTKGVSESGSVTIETLTQELDFGDSSSSASGSTNSMSGGMGAGMGASMGGAMGLSSASGSSSSGSSASGTEEALIVEEVYIAVGQKVTEGDAILKLTAESVENYRNRLEDAVAAAQATLTSASLSAEKQKLDANYSYEMSVARGSVAELEYRTTLEQLQETVDAAQEALDQSASMIFFYEAQMNQGIDFSEDLEKQQETYDKLYAKLQSAKNNYTTRAIEAKKSYDEAMLKADNAGSQYTVDITGVDSDVEDAKEALADAKEQLEEFEAFVGDGIIYAEYTGTVTAVGYAAGDELSTSTSVASYTDASSVSMEVSVSQEDITDMAVGDAVIIELLAYEDREFMGEILSIDTSASSGSSTVSYTVAAVFTEDATGIYADMTGEVTFIEERIEDVLYVSRKAIIEQNGASYVKRKDANGNVEQVRVTTGFTDGVNVQIVSGLKEGDTVLIEGKVKQNEN